MAELAGCEQVTYNHNENLPVKTERIEVGVVSCGEWN